MTRNGNYCYIFHYDPKAFSGLKTEKFIEAFNAEGIPTQASYPPVRKLAVFQTGEYRKKLSPDQAKDKHEFLNIDCPVTDDAYENTVWLVHRSLLGTEQDASEIVEAVKKIQLNAKELTK